MKRLFTFITTNRENLADRISCLTGPTDPAENATVDFSKHSMRISRVITRGLQAVGSAAAGEGGTTARTIGRQIASRSRQQNDGFAPLFRLIKCYRRGFLEVAAELEDTGPGEGSIRLLVEQFFDGIEEGFVVGCAEVSATTALLQEKTAQLGRLTAENEKKLLEISALYRMSNTMLSTIRLDKLSHLLLSSLTTGDNPVFDRALLFLINERSSTMQGMLGVTNETASGLVSHGERIEDVLATRWDISEEEMQRQQDTEFNRLVRQSRLRLRLNRLASQAVQEKKLVHLTNASRDAGMEREFIRRFGIKSCAMAPLMAKEQVVGVILVDNAIRKTPITTDDLRFLQLVVNQAGMAIENSILYNRLQDANRSLQEAREMLVQGERLSTIGEMATSIAHEVKGPLVSIGGFARRLERGLAKGSAGHESAATIVREVERLEKLLTNILSFARKTTICYSTCNICDIVAESLAIAALALEDSGIRVHTRYPARGIKLLGDSQQLKQVFLNILANAQEAMKSGGDLFISAGHTRLQGNRAAFVKISDTGSGIPLHALHNIFNSFFTTKEGGTGLGLSIANRIIVNHGGKIQISNKKDGGAEFNVIIPLAP